LVLAQSIPYPELTKATPSNPLSAEIKQKYNLVMQSGYGAAQSRHYDEARQYFQEALKLKPNDIYARQALFNIDTYELINQPKFPPLWLLLLGIVVIVIVLFIAFLLTSHQSQQTFLRKVLERRQQLEPLQQSLLAGEIKATAYKAQNRDYGPVSFSLAPQSSSLSSEDGHLPLHTTQLMGQVGFMEHLLRELSTTDASIRHKIIGELAQKADSRAIQPLVDLMMNSDSQEQNLILEALSQLCTRILKPMNQALTLSLKDKNPQMRKNAIRDLTRLYALMTQISYQLSFVLTIAVHDNESETQSLGNDPAGDGSV
jgi:tetratricopeptide (TPR) repeat protein